jgi:hypothetical protein
MQLGESVLLQFSLPIVVNENDRVAVVACPPRDPLLALRIASNSGIDFGQLSQNIKPVVLFMFITEGCPSHV